MTTEQPELIVTERGFHQSCLGRVLQLKIFGIGYPVLNWREVWEAFRTRYPGQWAVQVFPPEDALIDGKAVYHLWVLDREPWGLNLRSFELGGCGGERQSKPAAAAVATHDGGFATGPGDPA